MTLEEAYVSRKIGRFEMMYLALQLSELQKSGLNIFSFKDVIWDNGRFSFLQTRKAKQKNILLSFSSLLLELFQITDIKMLSVFMNHFLACQNDIRFFEFIPKCRKKPLLIACGGLSGSGKSHVAREIAPLLTKPYGAIVIRDDIVRKQLQGVSFDTVLDVSYYTLQEQRVYREMYRQAKRALMMGQTVVLDALFYNSRERKNAEKLSKYCGCPFLGIWMDAPMNVRLRRIQSRLENPSDVKTERDVIQQLKDVRTGRITWPVVSTDKEREEAVFSVMKLIKKYLYKKQNNKICKTL